MRQRIPTGKVVSSMLDALVVLVALLAAVSIRHQAPKPGPAGTANAAMPAVYRLASPVEPAPAEPTAGPAVACPRRAEPAAPAAPRVEPPKPPQPARTALVCRVRAVTQAAG